MARGVLLAGLALAASCMLLVGQAGATGPLPDAPIPGKTGFLSECARLKESKQVPCYVRRLLAIIDRSGNPAYELPRIDRQVHQAGGFLKAACHPIMHIVGREWARQHHLTLANLYHYVPRSNDPGCSAGFGMGLVMYLGPQLILHPRSVLETCDRLPTRFRQYTCIHGSGHAFMRGFHSQLPDAIKACEARGPRNAPDCAQGAFHDYWIALSGGDDAMRPKNADTSPRSVCSRYAFVRPCWFRYFWERRPNAQVSEGGDIVRLCKGLAGLQRAGCVAGASLLASRALEPADHARMCHELSGADTLNCLRGVNVPALAGNRFAELDLIRTCASLPETTRWGCYSWFGRTLAVVTDGRFERTGCPALTPRHARISCDAGAARMKRPLRTFS